MSNIKINGAIKKYGNSTVISGLNLEIKKSDRSHVVL